MLDENKLALLEEMASCFFNLEQIATALQVDQLELQGKLFRSCETPEQLAYNRGMLLQEAKVRKSIFKAAADGSGPAQVLAMKLIDNHKLDML